MTGYTEAWKRGKFRTNCTEKEFISVYINGENYSWGGKSPDVIPGSVMGPPLATDVCSVEQLEGMGMVGVYQIEDSSESDDTEVSKEKEIATAIRNSIHLGPGYQLGGIDWWLELDERRIGKYEDEEYKMVISAIAGFVAEGQMHGISPFWKLHVED